MESDRTSSWDEPLELGRQAGELYGLDGLRRLVDELLRVPIAVTCGFRLAEIAAGRLNACATSSCLILEG